MKERIILFFALLGLTIGLQAQILEPVKWSFDQKKISGNEFELIFKAEIDPTWHLYSQDIPMAPPATIFTFVEGSGYEFVGSVTEESKVIE